ncbi:MAG: sporulation protein YqfD [Bacilli bacterium]|nr:sporulation protein YqfD [Bacilli bacterium]
MRNRYLERLDKYIKIKIVGSNINNYLKRIVKKRVQLAEVIPVSYREVHVILKYSEYEKLLKFKSIYEITVLEMLGSKKIEANLKKNGLLLIFLMVSLVGIMLLSNVVFSIDIIHQDKGIRELLERELKKYGIVNYSLKMDYQELEDIEDKILENNKERLEWIEIDTYGTKYIVRVQERKLNEEEEITQYQSIVSKKDAVIVRIDAVRGEKVKNVNDYVSKGDTVISGYITRPDNSKVATQAEGDVYGEVWYQVDVDYPIVYQETNLTGKSKTVYVLYFFNHRIGLFDFDKYRSFEAKSKVMISSNMLDIKLVKEEQYEAIVKDEVYTEDIARNKAIDYIKSKLMKDNEDIVEIRDVKIMDTSSDEDSIEFNLFVKAIEDIGEIVSIEEVVEEDKESDDN